MCRTLPAALLRTAVLATAVAAGALDAQLPPAVELQVPRPPTTTVADGRRLLVYELHVTNLSPGTLTLRRLEVRSGDADDRVLVALEDSALARMLARPGVRPAPAPGDRARLDAGLRAIALLWIPLDAGPVPPRLVHRVQLGERSETRDTVHVIQGAATPVAPAAATIGPPLRGGGWLAANGPDPFTGHRRALVPVDGVASIAQRFGIDYLQVDERGRTFDGDRLRNDHYFAYGEDAIAVADGVVAATVDGIAENVPGITSRAVPITLATVGGNYVVLDIGGGRYAFYAHLQPGSLRVRTGDRVRRGDLLGLVGNSGNSTEPHLHFHVSDGISPLASQGLPYLHEELRIEGRCRRLIADCVRAAQPELRRREMPLANMILRFP